MKRNGRIFCVIIFMLVGSFVHAAGARQESNSRSTNLEFTCDSKLEMDTWQLWDARGFWLAKNQLLEKRLLASGDSYALYDFEASFHNLLNMAQRCRRLERQQQIEKLIETAYTALGALKEQPGRAWICRGGSICNNKNGLLGAEVVLNSAQFLALATDAARGIEQNDSAGFSKNFREQTISIALEHLTRWSNPSGLGELRKRIQATPADVKDGSSALFLMDSDIWQIAAYANLAGILASRSQELKDAGLGEEQIVLLKRHLSLLLRLVKTRITLQAGFAGEKSVTIADLDEGFRRLHADNRFAAYSGEEKPIDCARDGKVNGDDGEMLLQNKLKKIQPVSNLGVDISHARRLVHFFNAIERNRDALIKIFQVSSPDLPSSEVAAAFAHQLRWKVWNQDESKPLFTNYFNGANGWFRVGYNNGVGRCSEGYPPFALTNSFPTGGYIVWSTVEPILGKLGQQIYILTQSDNKANQVFVEKYYSGLRMSISGDAGVVEKLMFWPSLISH
jgi:hypothetical protein